MATMDTARIARRVSAIFQALATFFLVIGILAAAGSVLFGIAEVISGEQSWPILISTTIAAVVVLAYTAVLWAGVMLAAVVASYIADKSPVPVRNGAHR